MEENRKRYLDIIGITDKVVDRFVDETDQAVTELVDAARSINAEAFGGVILPLGRMQFSFCDAEAPEN